MCKIGVLSLQGSVEEHLSCVGKVGAVPVRVNTPDALNNIDGLIIPGGESTTLGILIRESGMLEPLKNKVSQGLPVWGTCAGMILLARKITGQKSCHLELMDIEVMRNGYGSQLESFTTYAIIKEVSPNPIPLLFIRAPYIIRIWGNAREILSVNGRLVAARQGNILATAFHPELTQDMSFHSYFINSMVNNHTI